MSIALEEVNWLLKKDTGETIYFKMRFLNVTEKNPVLEATLKTPSILWPAQRVTKAYFVMIVCYLTKRMETPTWETADHDVICVQVKLQILLELLDFLSSYYFACTFLFGSTFERQRKVSSRFCLKLWQTIYKQQLQQSASTSRILNSSRLCLLQLLSSVKVQM